MCYDFLGGWEEMKAFIFVKRLKHTHLSENKGGSSTNTLACTNDILNSYSNHLSLYLEYQLYCYVIREGVATELLTKCVFGLTFGCTFNSL